MNAVVDRRLASEQERALAAVAECEHRLRVAQDNIRWADEMLRRALRAGDLAESEMENAERQLTRLGIPSVAALRYAPVSVNAIPQRRRAL